MIIHHERDGALECPICEEVMELRKSTQGAPEVLLLVKEAFAQEHEPCEQYRDNPALAKANRKFCAGLREHVAEAVPSKISRSDRNPRRRCR